MAYCPTTKESRPYLSIPYSETLAEQIIDRMYTGERISEIIKSMPPLTLRVFYEWRAHSAKFDEKVKIAKKAQAELRADRVLEIADEAATDTEPNKPNYGAAISAYQWAAEKADPDSFGKKTPAPPLPPAPPQIVILTGLPSPTEAQQQRQLWLQSLPPASSLENAQAAQLDEDPE